jgi:hypothetical protein
MDNYYFKMLDRYNKGEKLFDKNILVRLENKLRSDNKPFNSIIDYVIHDNQFITMIDMQTIFYGNTIPHYRKIEVIKL